MTTTHAFHASPSLPAAPFHAPPAELDRLTVPYAGQTRMQLTITSGMAGAHLRVDPDATDLLAIDYGDGTPPRLRVAAAELKVSWPITFEGWLRTVLAGGDQDLDIVLHPAVEWALEIRGGLSHFAADLACGKLTRLEIGGGVSDVRLDLPAPTAVVPIRISGGASHLALRRPEGSGVTLAVSGGISDLGLDTQSFDAVGGSARLATGLVQGDRYAIEISGGASGLHVVAR